MDFGVIDSGRSAFLVNEHQDAAAVAGHYLYPGMLFAHSEPHIVSTILGSCVSVVLIDPVRKVGGVNHYIMPLWNGDGLATPKFGNIAIAKLYEKVLACGAEKRNIQAKVFGGASIHSKGISAINVGPRNVRVAFDELASLGVPIVASDTGGNAGRKLFVATETGLVRVKMLKNSISIDVYAAQGTDSR